MHFCRVSVACFVGSVVCRMGWWHVLHTCYRPYNPPLRDRFDVILLCLCVAYAACRGFCPVACQFDMYLGVGQEGAAAAMQVTLA